MSLTIGNKSDLNSVPGGSAYTVPFSGGGHNQNTGSNRFLLVGIGLASTTGTDFISCEYGGNPMSIIQTRNDGSLAQRYIFYGLQDPPTGINDLDVVFSASVFDFTSFYAVSFTNSSGAGDKGQDGLADPNNKTLSVSQNSYIYAMATSQFAISTGFTIDGSTRPKEFTHTTNDQNIGCLSLKLNAGTINVNVDADSGTTTNYRVEIQEFVSPSSSSGNFFLMF